MQTGHEKGHDLGQGCDDGDTALAIAQVDLVVG